MNRNIPLGKKNIISDVKGTSLIESLPILNGHGLKKSAANGLKLTRILVRMGFFWLVLKKLHHSTGGN